MFSSIVTLLAPIAAAKPEGLLSKISPYIEIIFGIAAAAIGRFVWKNHKRSVENKTRLDRYGRTLFGDEEDITHVGLAKNIQNVSDKVDALDERVDGIEDKIDRLCDKLDA